MSKPFNDNWQCQVLSFTTPYFLTNTPVSLILLLALWFFPLHCHSSEENLHLSRTDSLLFSIFSVMNFTFITSKKIIYLVLIPWTQNPLPTLKPQSQQWHVGKCLTTAFMRKNVPMCSHHVPMGVNTRHVSFINMTSVNVVLGKDVPLTLRSLTKWGPGYLHEAFQIQQQCSHHLLKLLSTLRDKLILKTSFITGQKMAIIFMIFCGSHLSRLLSCLDGRTHPINNSSYIELL